MNNYLHRNWIAAFAVAILLLSTGSYSQEQPTAPTPEDLTAAEDKPAAENAEETAGAQSKSESASNDEEKSLRIHGDVSLRYRVKTTDGEMDHDFYGDLRLEVDDIVPDKVFFSLYGRGIYDAGGGQEEDDNRADFFRDIYDSYETAVQGRLYHAHLTLDDYVLPNSLFRIGRQTVYIDQSYDFDGAFGEVRLHDVFKISAFGGASAFHFKGPRGGDWLVGTGMELTPIRETKINLDYVYMQEYAGLDDGRKDYEVILRLRQRVWKELFLLGQLSVLNDEVRDVSLKATWHIPQYEVRVKLGFYALVNEISDVNSSISRFFGAYQPYQQYQAEISKLFGEHFSLSAGYTGRVLDHSRDEGLYNREFHRFHATAAAEDWPIENLEGSVSVQSWVTNRDGRNETAKDNHRVGIDAEVSYRLLERKLKATVGTFYELYEYEVNIVTQQFEERVGVTGVYTKLDYQATDVWSCFGEFEWEYDELRDFYLVELGVRAKF